jgi:hypothetical protein
MSEDRLEDALEQMRQEPVDTAALEAARARVWNTLTTDAGCAEFRPDLQAYVTGALTGARRVLLEDHIGRCAACRAALAELKGERRTIAMPRRSTSRWTRWGSMAAAAAIVLSVFYLGRDTIDAWMAPGGPRATVVSAKGGLFAVPGGALGAGAAIGEKEHVRTSAGAHAVLRLADGSMIDVNERTEFYVTAAWSGQAIHLQRGDVVVQAAKQHRGHLRVLTRDSIASVKGTVFAVSAGLGGSVVSVVEGSVVVDQPGREVTLKPGQQASSNPALASSVAQAVSWSPEASQYLQILASFANIERQMATDSNPLRTSSALLSHLPAGAFLYGAVPNPGGKISQGVAAAEQQAFENAAFQAWWTSDAGLELRKIVDRVQSVSSLLGDEVVFSIASASPREDVPMVMARVQPGKGAALSSALDALFADAGEHDRPYSVSDELMVASDSPAHLDWALSHLGQDASSSFAAAIAQRYQRGAGLLIAVNAAHVVDMASEGDAPPIKFAGMVGVNDVFLEQRSPDGGEENEVTVTFKDPRTGMASWLADGGSGGAAEYLPADAIVAGYGSIREPSQLFQELSTLMAPREPEFQSHLNEMEQKLGTGFMANLTAAMGTEAAFALQGFSTSGPTWVMAALTNTPSVIDSSIATAVNVIDTQMPADQQNNRITLGQESVNGRVWNTISAAAVPFGVTWTYDGGYLVASSDRATAERAIATRNAGSSLVWSSAFQSQLPASAGIHPAAFAWLNAKGTLAMFLGLSPNPAVKQLLSERDPVLVVFNGTPDQIHAASRTRLSGVIIDAMLLQGFGRTADAQSGTTRH